MEGCRRVETTAELSVFSIFVGEVFERGWSFMIHIVKRGVPRSFGEPEVVKADTKTKCAYFSLFAVKMRLH